MIEEKKQSYLTKSDAETIHETLHGFLLLGVAIVVFCITIIDDRSMFTIGVTFVGCVGLVIATRRGAKLINSFVDTAYKEDQS